MMITIKWPKNFDERPHCTRIFHWENLLWLSTGSAAGQ